MYVVGRWSRKAWCCRSTRTCGVVGTSSTARWSSSLSSTLSSHSPHPPVLASSAFYASSGCSALSNRSGIPDQRLFYPPPTSLKVDFISFAHPIPLFWRTNRCVTDEFWAIAYTAQAEHRAMKIKIYTTYTVELCTTWCSMDSSITLAFIKTFFHSFMFV